MSNSDFLEIEHDGDTWRVLSTGVVSGDKTLCHLASLTRAQWNSEHPLMISDWVPTAQLELERRDATPVVAVRRHPSLPSTPKDHRIDDLEDALQLCVRAIRDLLPGAKHIAANVGLINEALVTARALLKEEKPGA